MIRIFTNKDINYIVDSHYRIYKNEYNYDISFKEFIINSLDNFIKTKNAGKENIWVVDVNGQLMGSVGIVKVNDETAQLRWFLLEPDQRGKGFGKQLLQEAINFCKANNYKKIILWTNKSLRNARKLYEFFGFFISESRNQFLSNQEIIEERWELNLER